ncbi:uncharacterized protein N7483_011736 [Penicillium malachiteum]|uniref:uncharacterized protein n=1 Tax=Penicillium malachiteum TaxID=1324776 RepID=UPI0025465EA7|nr:uncharacterized protein N7483_011736 [Penicillium malachiteum]KAJ5714555.1 hypothetical protein N7483_011736 [Penicillium malachiteum]
MNNLIERHRSYRMKRGRNEREATEDAMVHLSRHGGKVFVDGIRRMKMRELLGKREDVYYGRKNCVGLGELKNGSGHIFHLPTDARRVN